MIPGRTSWRRRLLGGVPIEVLHEQGAWTDQAHLSTHDVPEGRELVETEATQAIAEWRQPLLVWEQLSIGASRVAHASKLDELEHATIAPRPRLPEENRATELQPNQAPDCQAHGVRAR